MHYYSSDGLKRGACRYAYSADGGDCEKCGSFSFRQIHEAALDVQMSSAGEKSLWSSNVVKRIDVKFGIASPVVNKGLPQFEQKLRVVRKPLDARTECSFGEPLTLIDFVETTTPDANGAPLDSWQS